MALILSHGSSILLFLLCLGIVWAYVKWICALAQWLHRRLGDGCDD